MSSQGADGQTSKTGTDFGEKVGKAVQPPPESRGYAGWKSQLQRVEKGLVAQPGSVALLFLRGRILEQMDRCLEARNTYSELLALEPFHVGALNHLGNLLVAAGKEREAQRLYSKAVARDPDNLMSRMNLATVLLQAGEAEKARAHCEHALKIDPNCREAHARLASVFAAQGNSERAAGHRHSAYRGQCVFPLAYRGEQPPLTVLELI